MRASFIILLPLVPSFSSVDLSEHVYFFFERLVLVWEFVGQIQTALSLHNCTFQVRAFDDDDITHSEGEVNPINDLNTINDELRLKDWERLKRILDDRLKSRVQDKTRKAENEILESVLLHLEDGKWISDGKNIEQAIIPV